MSHPSTPTAPIDAAVPHELTRLAYLLPEVAAMCGLPHALVRLVRDDHELVHGIGDAGWRRVARPTRDAWLPCHHVMASGQAWAVEDTTRDPRTAASRTRDGVGAYLGGPITARDGQVLGTLCAYGPEPRPLHPGAPAALMLLARECARRLEGES